MALVIQVDAPFVPLSEYARRTGQSHKSVAHQADSGALPIKTFTEEGKRGKRFVNMLKLYEEASKAEY